MNDLLHMLVAGLSIGLVAALCVTRLLAHLLYHVQTTDVGAASVAALLVSAVAAAAAYMPCRRATAVDPAAALRYD